MATRSRSAAPTSTTAARPQLAERVARRIEVLAHSMLDAFLEEVPIYRRLPREQLEGEVLDICRSNLRTFFSTLASHRLPTDEEVVPIRASAARRAVEGIPLDAVLAAYHVGGRIGWDALREEATADEADELLDAARWVLDYLRIVTSAVAAAYLEERVSIYGEERDARRALVEAVLAGDAAETLAARLGIELARTYAVLSLRVGPSLDEQDAGIDGTVAGRRKVRRLEDALVAAFGPQVLLLLNPAGGWALAPMEEPPEALRDPAALHAALRKAAGAEIVAGVAWRPGHDGTAAAATEAGEVLRLVLDTSRPPGVYRLDDVLFDYVVTRPTGASDHLEALLVPLDAGPDLIATLEAYLGADLDRRAAAAQLHVHPNTLDYRLRRVAELTGLDPSSARGLQLLGAALTVRRARLGSVTDR